jgi:hypothetical protein
MLVNVVSGSASSQFSGLVLKVREGRITEIERRDLRDAEAMLVDSCLKASLGVPAISNGAMGEPTLEKLPTRRPKLDEEPARPPAGRKTIPTSRKPKRAATR